jgi:hypothetical protein
LVGVGEASFAFSEENDTALGICHLFNIVNIGPLCFLLKVYMRPLHEECAVNVSDFVLKLIVATMLAEGEILLQKTPSPALTIKQNNS